ncbi:family 16 glycosylhydrolase [Qipengyuania sp. 6B39]|uniref:glycoside hydrolase family 16 protein n=1 Tax=Qipengyuania proteolytica TaxID=2867239 RepID=UPI001C8B08CE|nr:glycoside hydrolase family 16 protein [Qipengyuania proteolytica]MBX7496323.1 family 16 glycosylhydrolase [Qipengyuania proteolytica]
MKKTWITAAALTLGMVGLPQAAQAAPPPPSGFSLTWADDFNGPGGTVADSAEWTYSTGCCFGTGQIATMTTSLDNVYQDGSGNLVIKAVRNRTRWTSGRIETKRGTFAASPGGVMRVQASMQLPNVTTQNGLGYWPGFWLLGSGLRTGGTWPDVGEIDIMESVNGLPSFFASLHCGTYPGGPCNEPTGLTSGQLACATCKTEFHTYAMELDRSKTVEEIRFYLDSSLVHTIRASDVDPTTWSRAMDHSFFILLDLYIGGDFPNALCNCSTPSRTATVSGGMLKIDYVAVYNKP